MSIFTGEFDDLRTNTDFNTFVTTAEDYKNSQEYADLVATITARRVIAKRARVCRTILEHFNNDDSTSFNPSATNLELNLSDFSADEITDLTTELEAKGYTITVDGTTMTVSSVSE